MQRIQGAGASGEHSTQPPTSHGHVGWTREAHSRHLRRPRGRGVSGGGGSSRGGPLAAGAQAPQCVLYNFTQPVFQNWRRYGNVRSHLGRNVSDLESERARVVFAGEWELPVKAH